VRRTSSNGFKKRNLGGGEKGGEKERKARGNKWPFKGRRTRGWWTNIRKQNGKQVVPEVREKGCSVKKTDTALSKTERRGRNGVVETMN